LSETIEFSVNRATQTELIAHLTLCDAAFVPPLSERVNIRVYAQKMVSNAIRFEAWQGGEIVGLVMAYCNDLEKCAAFVTSVSVLQQWKRRSIARNLMANCVHHIRQQGFKCIELEVAQHNRPAINLYERCGFVMDRNNGPSSIMRMELRK
jgi:ribosomal protein S18 acetylase RimI-like enzyme